MSMGPSDRQRIAEWQRRALAAEAEVERLLADIRTYREASRVAGRRLVESTKELAAARGVVQAVEALPDQVAAIPLSVGPRTPGSSLTWTPKAAEQVRTDAVALVRAALAASLPVPTEPLEAATAAADMCPRCHRDNSEPWALCESCAAAVPTVPTEPTCSHGKTKAHITDDSAQDHIRWCPGPGPVPTQSTCEHGEIGPHGDCGLPGHLDCLPACPGPVPTGGQR